MTDILLISPPLVNYDEKNKPKYFENTSFFPPIGLAYLSSYLEENGFTTEIIDMEADKAGISRIKTMLKTYKPKVIGLSIPSDMVFKLSFKIIEKIKSLSNCPIIIGGLFSSNNTEFILKHVDIDYVVRGEGEQTLLELTIFLLRGIGKIESIKGVSYMNAKTVIHNPNRELIKNLDDIPFPAWYKFNPRRYFVSISYRNPSFGITASRGCPYRCIFCCTSLFQYYRKRSPKNVVDEIDFLIKRFKIKDITFHDPTFNVSPKWVIDFCRELLIRKINIKWRCLIRPDKVNEKMIRYMKSAGCYNVNLGIETSKDKFLNFLKKDFSIQDITKTIKLLKKYKIEILGLFMLGIPGQTIDDLKHNVKFIKRNKFDYINIFTLSPLSGTELYELAIEKGWLEPDALEKHETPEKLAIGEQLWKIPNLDLNTLKYFIKKSYLSYFLSFSTVIKFGAKYLKTPSRILYAIRNIILRFTF